MALDFLMGAPVEIRNAEIQTSVVEVRTLTVGGKNMTLAVFRQLPCWWPQPRDELWGWVNYCPDPGCRKSYDSWSDRGEPLFSKLANIEHRHIVFLHDKMLCRYIAFAPEVLSRRGLEGPIGNGELWQRVRWLPQLFIAT